MNGSTSALPMAETSTAKMTTMLAIVTAGMACCGRLRGRCVLCLPGWQNTKVSMFWSRHLLGNFEGERKR